MIAPSGREFTVEQEGESSKELIIRFEYRPARLTDWPEDARVGKSKPPAQKDMSGFTANRLLAVTDAALAPWIAELGKPHVTAGGEKADYTRLEAHLKRYTARNTFDYFIHKDLGTFLRRELDFYIKNEIMHLDDVENESAPRVEQYLSKIKVIRKIAGKIIDFLAQIEDFQKKLWLKKKFVVETQYCIAVGSIPEAFYPEIVANEAQRQEWVKLFAIDEIKSPAGGKRAGSALPDATTTAGFTGGNMELWIRDFCPPFSFLHPHYRNQRDGRAGARLGSNASMADRIRHQREGLWGRYGTLSLRSGRRSRYRGRRDRDPPASLCGVGGANG